MVTFDAASWDALGCFFLEKKDILLALFPRMDGMAGEVGKKTKLVLFYCMNKRCAGVMEGRASVQKEKGVNERKKGGEGVHSTEAAEYVVETEEISQRSQRVGQVQASSASQPLDHILIYTFFH